MTSGNGYEMWSEEHSMKLQIDKATDALYLRLDTAKVIESEQVAPGVIVDFDSKNRVVGLEVLNVSKPERCSVMR